MTTSKKAVQILTRLQKVYTEKGMVDFGEPEDTLIATLLSARTTDEQVLKVYPVLRKKFPTLQDLAGASTAQIERCINSIGLFRNKAKAVKALAKQLLDEYDGRVPDRMEELIKLPGVGRKTASCVLGYAFKKPAIAVDIHVFRIAHRLGWVAGETTERVEDELKALVPEELWREVNRVIVQHGRAICRPRKPECWRCPIRDACPYKPKTSKP